MLAEPAAPVAVTVVVPGLPKGKGRPRFVRASGRVYSPSETVSYEGMLRQIGALEMAGRPPLEGPIALTMQAVFPIPASWSKRKKALALTGEIRPTGKPDIDNLIKVIDGLNGIVFRDDAQVWRVEASKVYGDRPMLVATFLERVA